VLGNVVSSGIKVLVLAVIVGIGSTLFDQFHHAVGAEPSLDQALAIMLASLSLLGLGIFGPGIATGLVSGGPQLGAGAAVGTALGATGLAVAGGAAVVGGARLALRGGAALRSATSLVSGARERYAKGRGTASAGGPSGVSPDASRGGLASGSGSPATSGEGSIEQPPGWARRLQRRQQLTHGVAAAAHVVRASDHGGGGASPSLREGEGHS
jgi:type IV secretion system protein TrbL